MNVDKIVIKENELKNYINSDKFNECCRKFRDSECYDKFLIFKEMEVAFKNGDIVTEKNEFICSFDIGEFNVYTENALNPRAIYEPKMKYKKVNCIKICTYFNPAEKFKAFLEVFRTNQFKVQEEMPTSTKMFAVYLNEYGDNEDSFINKSAMNEAFPSLDNMTLAELIVRNVFFVITLYCEIQKRALHKKEKIQKARSFFVGNTTGQERKPNQNYTVHLGKGIQFVYEPSNVHREFTRHCEAWNVRGHYRQYKTGKTIFIKPYTKGKGRLNQKQYIV